MSELSCATTIKDQVAVEATTAEQGRQYSGALGVVGLCQVAVHLAAVTDTLTRVTSV